ncbi:MAG: radical SAM protein [Kiritimatiellia bacterium]
MSLIYTPTGKAREYSPLALNVYTGGCPHRCSYCFCAGIQRGNWGAVAKPRNLHGLAGEAAKASRQVLLSFLSDPYSQDDVRHRNTRNALEILHAARCSVAILTKGGTRCLDDLGMFRMWSDGRVKVGATLTFNSATLSREWEPGAALPDDRLEALRELHDAGVQTWASIEPVIVASESLAIIEASLTYVDAYKVGRWNHDARSHATDWPAFGRAAVEMIRAAGKRLYVKVDLRPHFPDGYLRSEEVAEDALTLPDRPEINPCLI